MKTILIIEDEQAILENTIDLLILENYKPISADNGRLGIEKALSDSPDLILCDIKMPQMNGYQVLDALKKNPSTRDIPFVFISSNANANDIERFSEMGIDYLLKPFAIVDLLSIIEKYLKA